MNNMMPKWINSFVIWHGAPFTNMVYLKSQLGEEMTFIRNVGRNYLPIPKLQQINRAVIEVWEWTSSFIPYFIGYVITNSFWY